MKLSIVLPIYNEAPSLPELFEQLTKALTKLGHPYEIIAVNDGSRDESREVLDTLAKKDERLKVIHFRMNAGQTSALNAGIEHASGEVIVPMDADLENDPADIPKLLAKLDEGYDVVSGWRRERWKEQRLVRKLPSIIANWTISWVAGVPVHDNGCTLKAYRSDIIKDLRLYGEMHRLIAAHASLIGARVGEVEVAYRPRKYGKSNYGISRVMRVFFDLLLLYFMRRYLDRPIQIFGLVGVGFAGLGVFAGLTAIYLRLMHDLHLVQTPLPVFSALCVIVGVQLITMGIIAEILMRTYYESQNKRAYYIADTKNL